MLRKCKHKISGKIKRKAFPHSPSRRSPLSTVSWLSLYVTSQSVRRRLCVYLFFLDKRNTLMHNMLYFTALLNLNRKSPYQHCRPVSFFFITPWISIIEWTIGCLTSWLNGFQVFSVVKNAAVNTLALYLRILFCQDICKADS